MLRPLLLELLAESRALGFLGPGPVEAHAAHASGLADVLAAGGEFDPQGGRALDLGSGGGVPGLVLAELWPATTLLLLDANRRRTEFVQSAVSRLGHDTHVSVLCARAEVAGRDPSLRQQYGLVVARGFGPPATTAECAAPFLAEKGILLVAEPPVATGHAAASTGADERETADRAPERWPLDGCHLLGLHPVRRTADPVSAQVLVQREVCSDRYPRRDGMPAKRPLFS